MCACVLSVDVGFCVFLGPQGGRAACCFVLGHRRPPGGNKSSTCNSEQSQLACVLTDIHLGLSVSPPQKRWRLFSPARVCGFIAIIILKNRFGTNLPCCTMLISLNIKTENKKKKKRCGFTVTQGWIII